MFLLYLLIHSSHFQDLNIFVLSYLWKVSNQFISPIIKDIQFLVMMYWKFKLYVFELSIINLVFKFELMKHVVLL